MGDHIIKDSSLLFVLLTAVPPNLFSNSSYTAHTQAEKRLGEAISFHFRYHLQTRPIFCCPFVGAIPCCCA